MRFPKSKLYESAFTPILLGLVVGFVAAMMGIGGAFLMVPAMIYIVGMPDKISSRHFFICNNIYKRNSNYTSRI